MTTVTAAPPLPIAAYAHSPRAPLPFPLDQEECRLFARARHGLFHAVGALGLEAGDEILVPAYHHGSEVEALTRAGSVCTFYGGNARLEPIESELDGLLGPRTRAMYLIHYLGFPQDVQRWRDWCDARQLLLIEDVAYAWFATAAGQPLGAFGDAALFCLYKTFGFPDGAAVLLRSPAHWVNGGPARAPRGLALAARTHATWLASRSPLLSQLTRRVGNGEPYVEAEDFALGAPDSVPSGATRLLLSRMMDPAELVARRRANYRLLHAELADMTPPPFDSLPPTAVPYAFPIHTTRKDEVLRRLEAMNIRAFNFWSVPHPSLNVSKFPDAAARREHVIGLPVHQALELADVSRIVRAVRGSSVVRSAGGLESDLRREPIETIDALATEWDALALASGNVFSTREWMGAWWRHFGRGELRLSGWRDASGRLIAILPLYVARRGSLRVLRLLGHGAADELGPICHPADRLRVAQTLRHELNSSRCELFVGELLPSSEPWAYLLGGHTLRRLSSPKIKVRGRTWSEYLESLSSKFRKEIRYYESRLRRKHDVRVRTTTTREELGADLDTFLTLHRERWERASSLLPKHRFYRDVAAPLLARGWLRLSILELDAEPVAAGYDMRFAGHHSTYNSGRSVAWSRESVGLVLRIMTMREAFEDGIDEYRFLRGGEDYKFRFGTEDDGLETVAVGSGAIGTAAVAATKALGGTRAGRALVRRLSAW